MSTIQYNHEISKPISVDTVRKIKYHLFRLHDANHNNKYDRSLPYSFHLRSAKEQLFKIRKLMFVEWDITFIDANESEQSDFYGNKFLTKNNLFSLLIIAVYAHDSIEDCNITYNDLIKILTDFSLNKTQAIFVADIVYCVTNEKGKTRNERRNEKFYKELFANENAVLIKLSDMIANAYHTITFNHHSVENKLNELESFIDNAPNEIVDKYKPVFEYLITLLRNHHRLNVQTKEKESKEPIIINT